MRTSHNGRHVLRSPLFPHGEMGSPSLLCSPLLCSIFSLSGMRQGLALGATSILTVPATAVNVLSPTLGQHHVQLQEVDKRAQPVQTPLYEQIILLIVNNIV